MTWTKVCEKSDIPEGSIKKVWARICGGIPITLRIQKRFCCDTSSLSPSGGTIGRVRPSNGMQANVHQASMVVGLGDVRVAGRGRASTKTYDVKVEGSNIMVYVTEQLEYNFDEDEDIDENTFDDDDDDDDEW